MSTRSNLPPDPVIVNGAMAGNLTSKITILRSLTVGTYTYSWSGTSPVGEIMVEISNDYALNSDGTVKTAGTWIPVYFTLDGATNVNTIPVSGNTGVGAVEWSTGAYAIRTTYAATSGTGALQAFICGKVA